jgi:predicted alpha/beta superfamily hydrolase
MTARLAVWMSLATLALSAPNLCFSAPPATPGQPITMGERFALQSQSLGEMRSYQVHRPRNYDLDNDRYPVLLVLDGLEHFQHASATVDLLSSAGKIPKMLVVGIPNTNNSRYRDLLNIPAEPGASGLLKFITEELAPKIDRDYRTRPYRILVGWSSAGQYTLYSMLHAPQAFRGYIAIEPAFEGKREFPNAVIAFLNDAKDQNLNADVFVAMGDTWGSDMRRVWELSSAFQQRTSDLRDVRFTLRNYPEESHMSIPLRAVQDGLLSIFDGWQIVDPFALYEQGGLAAIEKHFTALAARTGLPTTIPDATLFDVYWNLRNRKRIPEAEQVLARALELHPDSLGMLNFAAQRYKQNGNTALASETSTKLLLLYPNHRGARSMLESLQVDASAIPPEVPVSQKDLAKYVGGYGTSSVVFEIERNGDKISGKTSERQFELSALSATKFRFSEYSNVYAEESVVSFRTDARGRVTGLVFEGGGELAKLR